MKREQIFCDRCADEIPPHEAGGLVEIRVTESFGKIEDPTNEVLAVYIFGDLCLTCRETLRKQHVQFCAAYTKKRIKVFGENENEEEVVNTV